MAPAGRDGEVEVAIVLGRGNGRQISEEFVHQFGRALDATELTRGQSPVSGSRLLRDWVRRDPRAEIPDVFVDPITKPAV